MVIKIPVQIQEIKHSNTKLLFEMDFAESMIMLGLALYHASKCLDSHHFAKWWLIFHSKRTFPFFPITWRIISINRYFHKSSNITEEVLKPFSQPITKKMLTKVQNSHPSKRFQKINVRFTARKAYFGIHGPCGKNVLRILKRSKLRFTNSDYVFFFFFVFKMY